MKQDICHFGEESYRRRVLWCDNGIAVHSGNVFNCDFSTGRR